MIITRVCSLFSDCVFCAFDFSLSSRATSSSASDSSSAILEARCSRVRLNSASASSLRFWSATVAAVASSRACSSAASLRTSSAARSSWDFSSASTFLFRDVISSLLTSVAEAAAARRMRSTPFCTRDSLALVFSLSLSTRMSSSCFRTPFSSSALLSTAAVSMRSDSRSDVADASDVSSEARAVLRDSRRLASSALDFSRSFSSVSS